MSKRGILRLSELHSKSVPLYLGAKRKMANLTLDRFFVAFRSSEPLLSSFRTM
jgi:hypothetical protein